MIKFELESFESFARFVVDVLLYHQAFERTGKKLTMAETFVWVYEKTGED